MSYASAPGWITVCVVLVFLSSCSGPHPNPDPGQPEQPVQPGPDPVATQTPEPLPSMIAPVPPQPAPSVGMWITFDVSGEKFRAVAVRSDAISDVLVWASGAPFIKTPFGSLERGGEFNSPWTWHLVPETVQFVDDLVSFPECMAVPSLLEKFFLDLCQVYLPPAKIESVMDCRSGTCTPLPVSVPNS